MSEEFIKSKEELLREIDECLAMEPKTEFMKMSIKELERYKEIIENNKDTYMSFAFKAKCIVNLLKQYKK